MLKVSYYVDHAIGASPVRAVIERITKESVRTKIKATIAHVAHHDGFSSYLMVKNVRGYHFSEVRIKFSKDLYRVLYFVWQGTDMVLLHIFVKREGEKTPEKELELAESRYKHFINNQNLYG